MKSVKFQNESVDYEPAYLENAIFASLTQKIPPETLKHTGTIPPEMWYHILMKFFKYTA